jgi:tetratricopeptide (TPR) repeat protein
MTVACMRSILPTMLVLLIGCSDLTHNPRADEAHQRWSQMRAQIKYQLAEKSFDNGAIDDALKQCNEAIRLDVSFADAFLLATRIYLERGEISKAQAALDTAETLAPKTVEAYYLRGLIAERQGRLEQALPNYGSAYEGDRDNLDCLLTYAEALIAADEVQEALDALTPRRMDFEQSPAVHALTGQALTLLGQTSEAAECYRLAVHLAPDNDVLREEAGIAFLAAGWDGEVIDTLMPLVQPKTTTRPAGTQAASASVSAFQALGTALLRSDRPGRAAQVLAQAVKVHAEVTTLQKMLAEAHLRVGSLDLAASVAEKVLELEPDDTEAWLLRAYVAVRTDRIPEAVATTQAILERNPDDIEARAVLARALERQPNGAAAAAEQYRHILSVFPDHRWARLQLQRLTQQARAD